MKSDGIIASLLYMPLMHIYRFLFEPEYRYYSWLVTRYGRTKRFCRRRIRLHQWTLIVPDVASFLSAYKEIFVEEIYKFSLETKRPIILDCGANIGLGILFFKKQFPQSRVIAFEADPNIFMILQMNMQNNGISDVELHNKAIWSSETNVEFNVEGADAGRINIGFDKNIISIPSVSLASIIHDNQFDFIKVDIEGAEVEALKGCKDFLKSVSYVFVEFHSYLNRKQELGRLINDFEDLGFRVHVHPPLIQKKPFLGCRDYHGMDMQLNLFFWKK